jgi:transcriptional regulator with XRE-family HTH domain
MGRQRITDDSKKYTALLAERLRMTRLLVEPKQVDAARMVGVKQNVWYRFERGIREVDPYAIAKFCILYEVDANWIILGDPKNLRFVLFQALFNLPEAEKYLRGLPRPPAQPTAPQNTRPVVPEKVRTKLLDL